MASTGAPFDPSTEDPYEVLGVSRTASAAEIREAWVALIKHTHSDRVGDMLSDEAKRINAAYLELRDPQRRRRWDRAHPSSEEARGVAGLAAEPPDAASGAQLPRKPTRTTPSGLHQRALPYLDHLGARGPPRPAPQPNRNNELPPRPPRPGASYVW